jgi:hypothetical protein
MKKKIIISLIIIILIGLITLLIIKSSEYQPKKYFNTVKFNNINYVNNNTDKNYYDTIIKVGLDELNLKDITILIVLLSPSIKSSLGDNYELKAHLRENKGEYVLFIDDVSREESITIISHELIHLKQYFTKELVYSNGVIYWDKKEFVLNDIGYGDRPWETDAFKKELQLSNKIKSVLYNKS